MQEFWLLMSQGAALALETEDAYTRNAKKKKITSFAVMPSLTMG